VISSAKDFVLIIFRVIKTKMVPCGAPTTKGTLCKNAKDSCPHHRSRVRGGGCCGVRGGGRDNTPYGVYAPDTHVASSGPARIQSRSGSSLYSTSVGHPRTVSRHGATSYIQF